MESIAALLKVGLQIQLSTPVRKDKDFFWPLGMIDGTIIGVENIQWGPL